MVKEQKKTHRVLRIILIAIAALVVVIGALGLYALTHTQVIVNFFQDKTIEVTGKPINSYEPHYAPENRVKDNGQYLISEICYSDDYPNSFLDITYPNGDIEKNRPTLFYFHGGGFFGGSKNMGDPLAESEATSLVDDICAEGYNIVNVDYVLVPEGYFPDPLIQANMAFSFVAEHADEYHINMNDVTIMGSSAGAIMAAQLGTIITNPEYAALIGVEPALSGSQVRAIVVDDAPLVYEKLSLGAKILVGNYVGGTIFLNSDQVNRYDCIPFMTESYPPTVLLASEYRSDLVEMHERLAELHVPNELIDPLAERGEEKPHCFVANEREDPIAKDAFDRMIAFISRETRNDQIL